MYNIHTMYACVCIPTSPHKKWRPFCVTWTLPHPALSLAYLYCVCVSSARLLSWIICWASKNNQMERRKEKKRERVREHSFGRGEFCCLSAYYSSGPMQTMGSPQPAVYPTPTHARALRFSLFAAHLFNPPQASIVFLAHTQTLKHLRSKARCL